MDEDKAPRDPLAFPRQAQIYDIRARRAVGTEDVDVKRAGRWQFDHDRFLDLRAFERVNIVTLA